MHFYENFAFFHPIRALKIAIRRRLIAWDKNASHPVTGDFDVDGDLPVALRQFERGELLPWKGVNFRVGKVVGGDFPAIILVPTTPTHGAKLRTMRNFRDAARFKINREREVRAALLEKAPR